MKTLLLIEGMPVITTNDFYGRANLYELLLLLISKAHQGQHANDHYNHILY